ncbi:NmrA family NAD(P)-binding protein [Patulibacter brassicae]|uniref:NmrA family NAD(P)-binding protein n=1 Tax=Patulibacter brassicae TaxID=1705717 RepID=A0ABU4VNH5_9ACTN|nr:NmrA family NAD(P)-binding protein [Patulibacter brassicae]MDX8152985.1 NmrA family NAD(P)-binding protein [Patulibacter brassicae]
MQIAVAGATGNAGRRITATLREAGHEVRELARSRGVDLTTGEGLDLSGVEVVVDAANPPTLDEAEATAFFRDVARTLGTAARDAGVRRTVLVSIVGVDLATEDNPYYAAKLQHEVAHRQHAPGLRILRATQFHEIAQQMLDWMGDGERAVVPDMPVQPVDLEEVARQVLRLATEETPELVELGGPRRERLPEMSRRLAAGTVVVEPGPTNDAIRHGVLLPGPDAVIAGRDFDAWLAARA